MTKLADVIDELRQSGLLDRVSYLKAGDIEVNLGPPVMRSAADEPPQDVTMEQEAEAVKRGLYGASRGWTPGVM